MPVYLFRENFPPSTPLLGPPHLLNFDFPIFLPFFKDFIVNVGLKINLFYQFFMNVTIKCKEISICVSPKGLKQFLRPNTYENYLFLSLEDYKYSTLPYYWGLPFY